MTSIPGHRRTRATRRENAWHKKVSGAIRVRGWTLSAFPYQRPAISPIRSAHPRRKL